MTVDYSYSYSSTSSSEKPDIMTSGYKSLGSGIKPIFDLSSRIGGVSHPEDWYTNSSTYPRPTQTHPFPSHRYYPNYSAYYGTLTGSNYLPSTHASWEKKSSTNLVDKFFPSSSTYSSSSALSSYPSSGLSPISAYTPYTYTAYVTYDYPTSNYYYSRYYPLSSIGSYSYGYPYSSYSSYLPSSSYYPSTYSSVYPSYQRYLSSPYYSPSYYSSSYSSSLPLSHRSSYIGYNPYPFPYRLRPALSYYY